jgi:hypothetical protein
MIPDLSTARWRKSTRSTTGGNCVEIAAAPVIWRKSSRSNTGGNCVEVADAETTISVRDSKDPAGPVLTVSPGAWTAFTAALNRGALA